MNNDLKKVLMNPKIGLLALAVLLTFVFIHPNFSTDGVLIISSKSPLPDLSNSVLVSINSIPIYNMTDYNDFVSLLHGDEVIRLIVRTEGMPYIYRQSAVSAYKLVNTTDLGLIVKDVPSSNLNFGLEISGGTKLVLKPDVDISQADFENVIGILRQRLDLFGVKGAEVTTLQDLQGSKYIEVSLAGVGQDEALNVLQREGKFEAKIGNETIFTGADIKSVCISGNQCTRVIQAVPSGTSTAYNFELGMAISQSAADRFANITRDLPNETAPSNGELYLNSTIDFYLDDVLIQGSSLKIPSRLAGDAITNPVITGSASSQKDAQNQLTFYQTILQSGSLPVKLDVESSETVSSVEGTSFAQNIFFIFIFAIFFVDIVIAIRYRDFKIVFLTIIISAAEILITIGTSAAIHWSLDVASIAGIIASVGTGVSDQIIILDEVMNKRERTFKEKMSRAFFIIIASYFVSVVSMAPLFFAGAGLLRGFALTTIIGTTVGVFITRPAFSEMVTFYKTLFHREHKPVPVESKEEEKVEKKEE